MSSTLGIAEDRGGIHHKTLLRGGEEFVEFIGPGSLRLITGLLHLFSVIAEGGQVRLLPALAQDRQQLPVSSHQVPEGLGRLGVVRISRPHSFFSKSLLVSNDIQSSSAQLRGMENSVGGVSEGCPTLLSLKIT
jgi:hypothetical protein